MSPKVRKETTTIAFARAFECKVAKTGFAHRVRLFRPQGIDAVGRYHTILALRGPIELLRYCRDQLVDRPDLAVVIDDAAANKAGNDNAEPIPLSEAVFSAIASENGPEAIRMLLQRFCDELI